jgi:hypothetical protein
MVGVIKDNRHPQALALLNQGKPFVLPFFDVVSAYFSHNQPVQPLWALLANTDTVAEFLRCRCSDCESQSCRGERRSTQL